MSLQKDVAKPVALLSGLFIMVLSHHYGFCLCNEHFQVGQKVPNFTFNTCF